MPTDNDLLKTSADAVKTAGKPPPEPVEGKAVPAYWGRKLLLPYKGAMRVAGIALDAEITEAEFKEALVKHGILDGGKDKPARTLGYGKPTEEVT
jgi:hypothetical protein